MKRMLMLVLWGTAGISLAGLMAAAGPATAGIASGAVSQRTQAHVINLHEASKARLAHTAAATPVGYFTPKPTANAPGRGGNGCAEPDCPLTYHEGPVQINPHVYLLLWGPNWLTDPNQEATASYLENFYQGLGTKGDNWSTLTSQYGDSSGPPTFGSGVYEGYWNDISTPPTGVTASELAAKADAFASAQGITDIADAQIVIATQSGTCPAGFYAPAVCSAVPPGVTPYCAWHGYSNEPFINLPYQLDAGSACGEDSVNAGGTYDGVTIAAGHEYADTITDPQLMSGWWDPVDQSGGEIADKCAWTPNSGDVELSTGSFALQPLWSNSTSGTGGSCVMPAGSGSDVVTLNGPENQSNYYGSGLTLSISGTSTKQLPLTWTAQGLPTGLSIAAGPQTPGVISGHVDGTTKTPYVVTVEISDSTGSSASITFDWTVEADVGENISNQAAALCLNLHAAEIAPNTEVVMYTCRSTGPAEMFTHPTNTGELIVLGQCLTDHGTGRSGTLQFIEPCTAAPDQEWYYNSKHEYVVEMNLLCLTDPGGSTLNGEPTVVQKCTDAKDQRWTVE
jgi:hypothetical protein